MAGTKVMRSKLAIFLDTSANAETPVWSLIGDGVTEQTIAYNPQTSEEIYVHQDTGTTDVESYKPNIPTPMTAIKGDPVFDYVDGLRKSWAIGTDARTKVCIVYLYETASTGKYPAEQNECSIQIDDFGGAGTSRTVFGDTNVPAMFGEFFEAVAPHIEASRNKATKKYTGKSGKLQ